MEIPPVDRAARDVLAPVPPPTVTQAAGAPLCYSWSTSICGPPCSRARRSPKVSQPALPAKRGTAPTVSGAVGLLTCNGSCCLPILLTLWKRGAGRGRLTEPTRRTTRSAAWADRHEHASLLKAMLDEQCHARRGCHQAVSR